MHQILNIVAYSRLSNIRPCYIVEIRVSCTRKIPRWAIPLPPSELPPIKLPLDNLLNPNLTLDGGGIHREGIDQGGIFRTPLKVGSVFYYEDHIYM